VEFDSALCLGTNLSTTHDGAGHSWPFITVRGHCSHSTDDIHTFNHLTKSDVLVVQLHRTLQSDEELRSIAVSAFIGHADDTCLGVATNKVFIIESATIDTFATISVVELKVTSLDHKVFHGTKNLASFVAKLLLCVSPNTIFPSAEATEILRSSGSDVWEKLNDYTAARSAADGNV